MDGGHGYASSITAAVTGRRSRIVRRYFLLFSTLVGGSPRFSLLLESGYRVSGNPRNLELEHRQMAELAALQIRNYINDVAQAVRLAAQPRDLQAGRVTDDYAYELRNLLRNVPAIRNVVAIGTDGREQLRLSR